jgi:hypothetical protein
MRIDVTVKGYKIGFDKKAFKNVSYTQFKEAYQFQYPFTELTPVFREKELQRVYDLLKDNAAAPEIENYEIAPKKNKKVDLI